MLRYIACLLLALGGCQSTSSSSSQDTPSASEDKGPQVNALVKPDQEKRLAGQVQNPAKARFTNLLVFGDSLSDAGQLHKLSGGAALPPRVFYKSRFSNGPIWTDYVSNSLNWTLSNFAVGLAGTRETGSMGGTDIPSLLQQISKNKSELKKMDFATTLVVIWAGQQNYIRHALKAQDANQNPVTAILEKQVKGTISDIHEAIEDLKEIGFQNFAIGTMPELGGLNRSPKDPPQASDATLQAATAAHNIALRDMLKSLPKEMPEVNVTIFQAYEINQKTNENPKTYGFTRLDAPCYAGSLQGKFEGEPAFCTDPSGYKYWDHVHPNSRMQCIYATQFLADITAAGRVAGYDQAKALARCLEL